MKLSDVRIPGAPVMSEVVVLTGGLDQVTPNLNVKPGYVRRSQNVEIDINGGYLTATGYERFNGDTAPSSVTFSRIDVTITGSLSIADTVTGATSAATGEIIAISNDSQGQDYIVIAKVAGTFQAAENLEVAATPEAITLTGALIGSAETSELKAQYTNLAADNYRADIAAPVGSGPILGVMRLNDTKYCWRNNAGDTEANLWKATSSGWTQIALGFELSYTSGGTSEILIGQVIEGAISGAQATLTGITLESGTWAGGDAVGRFIFASQTGTFQAENIDIVAGGADLATIAGDSDAITFLPDGRFETENQNFGGVSGGDKVYGADKVNRGFEFYNDTIIPIQTGMTVDTPTHASVHKNHLFFSFHGSSQHSGIGVPQQWTIVSGAAELVVGDYITNYLVLPGAEANGALAIISLNRVHILYGNSSADWNLVQFRREVGGYEYTCREFGMAVMFDDRGVKNLATSQDFGNLSSNVLSRLIQPWTNERRSKATGSCIARDKSQYRLFFSDQFALYITIDNNRIVGMMPQYLAHAANCTLSFENSSGQEEIYFGGADGMVYQMEKGTSFDGENISYHYELPYHHSRTPRKKKRYQNAVVEVAGSGFHRFSMTQRLGYNDPYTKSPDSLAREASFSSVQWDVDMVWDDFVWDGSTLAPERFRLTGRAENISLIFSGDSDYYEPLLFSSVQMKMRPGKYLK